MSRSLPAHPDLEHVKKQAKSLLRQYQDGAPAAAAAFREFGGKQVSDSVPKLSDAQHVIAREYGFLNWPGLRNHVLSLSAADGPSALEAAVRLDDAQRVRDVLARFPSLGAHLDDALPSGDFGATALITAANLHNRDMIDVLLDAGADVNQRSHWWAGGFSALDSAPQLDQHLVSRGATVTAYDAARFGLLDRLRELVTEDPSVVATRFGDGQTALHVATSVEIAEYLIENGAQIDSLDVDHESTPAQYLLGDHQDVVRFLISRGCKTDILMAAAVGDMELVRRILDANPQAICTTVSPHDFPMQDSRAGGTIYIWSLGKSKTPHAIARQFGHEDVVALLLENTPAPLLLALACEAGDDAGVARLTVANPHIRDQLNGELLRWLPAAAELNNARGVNLMLDAGWDPTTASDVGVTSLHWAAFHGNTEMLRALLDHGADVHATDRKFGGTALGWARHGEQNSRYRETGNYPAVFDAISAADGP
ncbi:MAG: ankyrin repeat domain-containing protein [Gemmatimonadaceae bacterium]